MWIHFRGRTGHPQQPPHLSVWGHFLCLLQMGPLFSKPSLRKLPTSVAESGLSSVYLAGSMSRLVALCCLLVAGCWLVVAGWWPPQGVTTSAPAGLSIAVFPTPLVVIAPIHLRSLLSYSIIALNTLLISAKLEIVYILILQT